MAEMKYLDFDLLIERAGERYKVQASSSTAGQAFGEFSLPFSELEIENFLLRVGRPRRSVRRVDSQEMEAVKNFGSRLFDAVFDDEVRACLRSSLEEAERHGAGLRLRLRLTKAPELTDLPWEYLYNRPLNRFLSLAKETPIVRYLELPERIRPLQVKPPLQALIMISSPYNVPGLDVEREWALLNQVLHDLELEGLVTLERMERATLAALQRQLRQGEYHIFHFIGHGGFDQQAKDGVLMLEDDEGRGRPVSGQYLGTLLHNHRPLRLALLNACEGGRASRSDPFAGTAQSLMQQGLPAVIAMQFEITDAAAIAFTREFYAAVADGEPIDAAMVEARAAIFAQGDNIEWGTPVLYMRAPDGRIFDIERMSHEERRQAKLAVLNREEENRRESVSAHTKAPKRMPVRKWLVAALILVAIILGLLWIPKLIQKSPAPLPQAFLSIVTSPDHATVFLNADSIGVTPLHNHPVQAGTFSLRIQKRDYVAIDTTVVIAPDKSATFSFSLKPVAQEVSTGIPTKTPITEESRKREEKKPVVEAPRVGEMQIFSDPTGAAIFLNGQTRGTTPLTISDLALGDYEVVLKKDGHEDFSTTVAVAAGEVEKVNATLTPLQGTLRVLIKPVGSITIDGALQKSDATDWFETRLAVGTYRVKMESAGLGFLEKTVTIEVNKQKELSIDFDKMAALTVRAVDELDKALLSSIVVDGNPSGQETPKKLTLRVGHHVISVRREGYTLVGGEQSLDLEADLDKPLKFVLRKN